MADNKIYNIDKLSRPVDFSGLCHCGSCSPTDIDFCIEIGDMKKYLIGDFKEEGKELTTGQKILLERHCAAFAKLGYISVAFLAWHPGDVEIIKAHEAIVVMIYRTTPSKIISEWKDCKKEKLLIKYNRFFGVKQETIDRFIVDAGLENAFNHPGNVT